MKLKKSHWFASMLMTLTVLTSTPVIAGTTYGIYNTTIGSFSAGYTGTQSKKTSGANGGLWSTQVSGGNKVYAQMQEVGGEGRTADSTPILENQHSYELPGHYTFRSGDKVRVRFSKSGVNFSIVQVSGHWKSN